MELDMFLTAKKTYYPFDESKEKNALINTFKEIPEDTRSLSLSFTIGYWRKANHIHAWFVHSVQEGKDDCTEYYVSREQLKELRELCTLIKDDHSLADTLLPTKEGCFFGCTDYDNEYFESLDETIIIIDKTLALPIAYEFYYQSSW